MDLRERINAALKDAMRARDADRLSALRMMTAAIKDKDIAMRGEGAAGPAGDTEVLALLGKMVKQRQESAKAYHTGARPELAAKEEAEIGVIEGFLPRQLSVAETDAAITAAIAATGAAGLKDMGRVMAELKGRYTGQMHFGAVGPMVKAKLAP